jgi:hypothetical protein
LKRLHRVLAVCLVSLALLGNPHFQATRPRSEIRIARRAPDLDADVDPTGVRAELKFSEGDNVHVSVAPNRVMQNAGS